MLRFMQASGYDCEMTYKSLTAHLEWRLRTLPIDFEEVETLAQTGLLYLFGRDRQFRPVLHFPLKRLCEAKVSAEQLVRLAVFMLEFATRELLVPGKVETLVTVVEMEGVGVMGLPMGPLKAVGEVLRNNYKGRVYKQFALNTPGLVKGLYGMFRNFVDNCTVDRAELLGDDYSELHNYIDRSQLEKKMGGMCEDVVRDFFPPRLS